MGIILVIDTGFCSFSELSCLTGFAQSIRQACALVMRGVWEPTEGFLSNNGIDDAKKIIFPEKQHLLKVYYVPGIHKHSFAKTLIYYCNSHFYKWVNWSPERLINLSQVTKVESCKGEFTFSAMLLSNSYFFFSNHSSILIDLHESCILYTLSHLRFIHREGIRLDFICMNKVSDV